MRKFSFKDVTTATLIWFIIAIIWFADGIYLIGTESKTPKIEPYSLTQCESNPEYEGKLVFTSGKIVIDKTANDSTFGVTCDGAVLKRTVEMYQYKINGDTVEKSFSPLSLGEIKGQKGEIYSNPDFPSNCRNTYFYGEASFGEGKLNIDNSFLYAICENEKITEKIDCGKNLKIKGYTYGDDGYYYKNSDINHPKIGDLRIKFEYAITKDTKEVSMLGIQSDNSIKPVDNEFSIVTTKCENAEECVKTLNQSKEQDFKIPFLLGGICLAVAVFLLIKRIKKFNKGEI